MAASPSYTPVNAINWELRDLSNQTAWRASKENNPMPSPSAFPAHTCVHQLTIVFQNYPIPRSAGASTASGWNLSLLD